MHYVLIFVLYTSLSNINPILGHKVFNSSALCEAAKTELLSKELPKDVKGAAVCISEAELLNYTRT